MTATGSKIFRDMVLSWPPVCPAQGSPDGLGAGWPIPTVVATHNPPPSGRTSCKETPASVARGRSSRTTLY